MRNVSYVCTVRVVGAVSAWHAPEQAVARVVLPVYEHDLQLVVMLQRADALHAQPRACFHVTKLVHLCGEWARQPVGAHVTHESFLTS